MQINVVLIIFIYLRSTLKTAAITQRPARRIATRKTKQNKKDPSHM